MIRHTPGEWSLEANGTAWNLRTPDRVDHFLILVGMAHNNPGELEANAHLIAAAPTAPYECADPQCPGNVNRRKLDACASLFCACTKLLAKRDGGIGPSDEELLGIRAAVAKALV